MPGRLLLPWVLGASLGCGQPAPVPPEGDKWGKLRQLQVAQRWIPDDPASFLKRTGLLERVPVESWSFRRAADLESWQPRRFDRVELGRGGLLLQSSKRRPRLLRQVDWQAASVDALVLEVPEFTRGLGRLYWAREGEEFSEARSLAGRLTFGVRPLPLIFDVGFEPEWRGRIRRIAIELFSPENLTFRLRTVSAVRYRPVAGRVAAAGERAWKIDLDHEVRNGLLALPGSPVTRRLTIPPAAVLRVGFASDAGARQPIVFSVVLDPDDGAPTPLIEIRVDPRQPPAAGRWHDREIDLSAFAGVSATLRLETRVPGGDHDLVHGFAFWANPEVLVAAPSPRPNVVVISIDTLRADHLPLYGYSRATSPNLDRWAKRRAVVFDHAVAAAPWTIPSHVSIFTGLDALRHGVNHPTPVPGRLRLMAELFRDAGYASLAITGGGFMQPQRGFVQGFDRYRYWPKLRSVDEIDQGIDRALEWLDGFEDRPFFLFFHTFEVHYPFRRRAPFFARFAGEQAAQTPEVHVGLNNAPSLPEEGFLLSKKFFWKTEKKVLKRNPVGNVEMREIIDRYDSGIAYADDRLARLLARLEEPDLEQRMVIVVTSDHGEALGEEGFAGHAYLYDWNLLVPLLVAAPGLSGGRRVETQVRSVDLLPTVAELAGLEPPPDVDGVSLVPLLNGAGESHPREAWSYAAFSNRGLALRFDNRIKYHYNNTAWAPLNGREELYDLRSDPQEGDNLAGSQQAAALRSRTRLRIAAVTAALEVRFTNVSADAFGGRISGVAIHPTTVKAPSLPDGALVWQEVGAADFLVRPGESWSLWLERSTGSPRLALRGAFEGPDGDAFEAKIEVAEISRWQVVHGDAGWTIDSGDDPGDPGDDPRPATAIVVRWQGLNGSRDLASPPIGPELDAQLRALGYVDF